MISSRIDSERQLTVFTCIGKVSAEEVSDLVTDFYQGVPTPHNLWNLEQADLAGWSSDDVVKIVQVSTSQRPEGLPGKTAIVSSRDLAFGMGRMFETYRQFEKLQVDIQVFRSMDEALAWMDES